jgi:para-nitrobenzyl esterase
VPKAAKAIEQGDAFGAKLNCPPGEQQMACLRGKDVAEILNVSPTYADIGREGIFWHPFVDGEIVTNDVFSAVSKGQFNRVPMMVGTTRDEGRGFTTLSFHADNTPMTQEEYVTATANWVNASVQPLLTQMIYPTSRYGLPALAFSQVVTDAFACLDTELARKALSHAPTYVYEFADRTAPEVIHDPFMASGAYHVSDIPYLFRTPFAQQPPIVLNAAQARLSAQMLRYWKSFVDTGNPNPSASVGDPVWPKYDAISTPVLTWVPDATHLQEWGAFQRAHQCSIWSILYSLRGLGAV